MKIKKDIADLKAFMDNIEDEVVDFMDEKAHEALIEQKAARLLSGKRDYLNHTWNLRSSLGYVVTYDGKEKRRYISGMNYGDEAAAAITKWLNEVNKAGTSIVFADGMFYASFVSSKGYDVIDTAESYLTKELNK
ncbi:hypothetical protein [Alistipes finegoldii]|uniref:hypothetical protein n=1 Tax=Alistipes finegoldii TaxID=214856 RepID=UPI002431995B|nr:hypothetical protein [Alistipes finegoldii]